LCAFQDNFSASLVNTRENGWNDALGSANAPDDVDDSEIRATKLERVTFDEDRSEAGELRLCDILHISNDSRSTAH